MTFFFTCLQEVPFNTTFYKSPIVILSVNHEYNLKCKGSRLPENNIISAWVEVGFNLDSKVRKQQTLFRDAPTIFFHKMTSDGRAQKLHTDDLSLLRSGHQVLPIG